MWKLLQRFMDFILHLLFLPAIDRKVIKEMAAYERRMGGPGRKCINPETGEVFYEYGHGRPKVSHQYPSFNKSIDKEDL